MVAMHILLDAKDLINVLEHSNPMKLSEFDGWLRARDADLVCSLVNIRGLAAPLALGSSFLPQVKGSLDRLESLPHSFVTSGIDLLELQRALDCFDAGKEYVAIDPYVERATQVASWIAANPLRCPAMWLARAVGFSMSQNQSYAARKDDTFDMAEMWTIPYTDAATVDRCMLDLFSRAARNLRRKDNLAGPRAKVYRSLSELMASGESVAVAGTSA